MKKYDLVEDSIDQNWKIRVEDQKVRNWKFISSFTLLDSYEHPYQETGKGIDYVLIDAKGVPDAWTIRSFEKELTKTLEMMKCDVEGNWGITMLDLLDGRITWREFRTYVVSGIDW